MCHHTDIPLIVAFPLRHELQEDKDIVRLVRSCTPSTWKRLWHIGGQFNFFSPPSNL